MFPRKSVTRAAYSPPPPRSKFAKKAVAFGAAVATAGALTLSAAPAHAAELIRSGEAEGAFIDIGPLAQILETDVLAELAGANQTYPPDAGSAATGVPANLLSILQLEISRLLSVDFQPNDTPLVSLGAIAQYARANSSAVTAASGAITNTGVVELNGANGAPPANATFDLSGLLGDTVANTIGNLELEVGALASQASIDATSALSSQYGIAGVDINLSSPAVGGIYTSLQDFLIPVNSLLTGLEDSISGAINTLLGDIDALVIKSGGTLADEKTVNVTLPDLNALLPSGDQTSNGVTINLQTGEIGLDLKEILSAPLSPMAWEELDANQEILDGAVLTFITSAIVTSITGIIQDFVIGVENAVDNTQVEIGWKLEYWGPGVGLDAVPKWRDIATLDVDLKLADTETTAVEVNILVVTELLDIVLGVLGISSAQLTTGLASTIVGLLDGVLNSVDAFGQSASTLIIGLRPIISPILGVIDDVISLKANTQQYYDSETDSFTEIVFPTTAASDVEYLQGALKIGLLNLGDNSAVSLHLATSKVMAQTFVLEPSIIVAPESIEPGRSVVVEGSGFTPGGDVTVQLVDSNGDPVGDAKEINADANGDISTSVTVPEGTPAGNFQVKATDEDSGEYATARLIVEASGSTDGATPGETDGATPGETDGATPGETDGATPGTTDGATPGETDGATPGTTDGAADSATDGATPGETDGATPGDTDGATPGETDGSTDGATPGETDGATDGATPGETDGATDGNDRELAGEILIPVLYRGDLQTWTASGFNPGEKVSGYVESVRIDLPIKTADADGQVSWTFTIPAEFELGQHTATAVSEEFGDSVSDTFEVIVKSTSGSGATSGSDGGTSGSGTAGSGGGTTNAGGGLAVTGAEVTGLAAGSGILVLLGIALFAIRRVRSL